MTVLHIPDKPSQDWSELYMQLAVKYAETRNATALFALAVMKRAEENGDTYLADGAARMLEIMENRR